jgi:hypothetical protein
MKPRFGYSPGGVALPSSKLLLLGAAPAPASYDQGVTSPMIVQSYDDCVEVTVAKLTRRREILQRPLASRANLPLPALPSARWGYWQWLESIGKLGQTTTGTDPALFLQLLNTRGWCADPLMPYLNDDGSVPGVDIDNAPSLAAIRAAYDERNTVQGHLAMGREDISLAFAKDLGVGLAIACDTTFVTPGGIPDDPDFVWDFDPTSDIAGWHLIEGESYDERGVLSWNTWGLDFAHQGHVRIGWTTIANPAYCHGAVVLDTVVGEIDE